MDLRQSFELKKGGYSCHMVIGKSLLGNEGSIIPKKVLELFTMASGLCWTVRQTLARFVESYIFNENSQIVLCRIISKKKGLSLLHCNKVV